jgi:hypothetical protein
MYIQRNIAVRSDRYILVSCHVIPFKPLHIVINNRTCITECYFVCFLVQQPPQWARAPSFTRFLDHAPQSVGFLWMSDQLVAETSTWQHTTLPADRHPCPRRDSNPQSQQGSGRRPTLETARQLGPAQNVISGIKGKGKGKGRKFTL